MSVRAFAGVPRNADGDMSGPLIVGGTVVSVEISRPHGRLQWFAPHSELPTVFSHNRTRLDQTSWQRFGDHDGVWEIELGAGTFWLLRRDGTSMADQSPIVSSWRLIVYENGEMLLTIITPQNDTEPRWLKMLAQQMPL